MLPVTAKCDNFTKSLVLFLSGILAHLLSGGAVIEIHRFLVLSGLIGASLFLTRNHSHEGPQLALMILILQSSGHFILGGADKSNDVQMSGAHLLAGIISYKTVVHFDRFWEFLAGLAHVFFMSIFRVISLKVFYICANQVETRLSISHLFYSSRLFRGPPTREIV